MITKSVLIILTALLAPFRADNAFMGSTEHVFFRQERYYSVEDFNCNACWPKSEED